MAEALCARQIDCVASVATEYGREVMRPQEHLVIREGRMSEPEMEELMRTGAFLAVVDATHPYAVEVTEHIKESAKKTNLPYLRLSRSTAAEREIAEHEWMIHTVADTQECVKLLSSLPGNILLTTGSKELHAYAVREEIRKRLFVRVLPGVESIEICHREQIPGKQIDLVYILCGSCCECGSHLSFPSIPCSVCRFYGNSRVSCLKCLDCL